MPGQEAAEERAFVRWCRREGHQAIKLRDKGWPDRLVLLRGGMCVALEFKAPGARATKLQLHYIQKLRCELDVPSFVVHSCDRAKFIVAAAMLMKRDALDLKRHLFGWAGVVQRKVNALDRHVPK